MAGAWQFILLHQGEQLLNSFHGEFCRVGEPPAGSKAGSPQRYAKVDVFPIDHEDVAGAIGWMTDGVDQKASPVQRMGRVDYFDFARIRQRLIANRGINLLSR